MEQVIRKLDRVNEDCVNLIRKLPEDCVNLILNIYFISFTDEIWIPFSHNNKWKYKINKSPYLHISLRNVCQCKTLNPVSCYNNNKEVVTIVNNSLCIKYVTIVNEGIELIDGILIDGIVYIMIYYTQNLQGNEHFLWGTSFFKNKKQEIQIQNGEFIFIKESVASELWREQWGYTIPPLQIYM